MVPLDFIRAHHVVKKGIYIYGYFFILCFIFAFVKNKDYVIKHNTGICALNPNK